MERADSGNEETRATNKQARTQAKLGLKGEAAARKRLKSKDLSNNKVPEAGIEPATSRFSA